MKLFVANPIYDSVFKYLIEDVRIAKILLSALLKKEVLKVEPRPHEYSNITRNNISMFRIDFGATVREADGSERLVLIELQKTWLETETLRFRQYLSTQYSSKANIVEDSQDKHALPMVAVYLLGHKVEDINVPVIYVNHNIYDYNGNLVETKHPSPFVGSLTHECIIVQIPLLHGRINNRLEKVLSIFDQSNICSIDHHVIEVNENSYADDHDMQYIVRRLQSAIANPHTRKEMNIEDEFFKAIEDRDTTLMAREKRIQEQDKQLREQEGQLREQEGQLREQNQQLREQEGQLREQDQQLREQEGQLREQNQQLREQNQQIKEQDRMLRAMITMMLESGTTIEEVAQKTGLTPANIHSMLNN